MANPRDICIWILWCSTIIYGPVCCRGDPTQASAYTVEDLCHLDREPNVVKGCTVKVESVHTTVRLTHTLACARHCSSDTLCIGYSFYPGQTDCYFHYNCGNPQRCDASNLGDVVFYRRKATPSECDKAGGVWNSKMKLCQCQGGVVGRRCERLPESCSELAFWGYTYKYQTRLSIKPHGFQDKITVACKLYTSTKTALTLVMRNIQKDNYVYGRLSDTNKWENCVKGVDTTGIYVNFWSGLENIRYLSTASNSGTLTLDIDYGRGLRFLMSYHGIKIEDASRNYALSYRDYELKGYPPYLASVENCLPLPDPKSLGRDPAASPASRAIPFSAPDADHDLDLDRNCAELAGRGWWFAQCDPLPVCSLMGDLFDPKVKSGRAPYTDIRFSVKPTMIEATKAFFTHNYTDTLPGL